MVTISKKDYEFLQYCKSNEGKLAVVFSPEEYKEGTALRLAEIQEDIIKGSINEFQEPIKDDEKPIDDYITNFFKEAQEQGFFLDEKNQESLIVLECMKQQRDIADASYLLLNEIDSILNEKLEIGFLEPFFMAVENFIKIFSEYKVDYEKVFKQRQGNAFERIKLQGDRLQNAICHVITELIRINPLVKETEVFHFLNKDFCPQVYEKYKKEIESASWYSYLKGKARDIMNIVNVHGTSHIFYGMLQNKYTKFFSNTFSFLTRNFNTLYTIYVFTGNLGLANIEKILGGEMAFMDIILTIALAACEILGDLYILGQVVKFILSRILQSTPITILSARLAKGFGVFVGNAVSYLGPALLSISLQKVVTYSISSACAVLKHLVSTQYNIYSFLLKQGTSTLNLYNDIKNMGLMEGMTHWWDRLDTNYINQITESCLLAASYPKTLLEQVSSSAQESMVGAYEKTSGIFSWKNISGFFGESTQEKLERMEKEWKERTKYALVLHSCNQTGTCQATIFQQIVKNLKTYYREIQNALAQIIELIKKYGTICSDYISQWLGVVVSRFNAIYATCTDSFSAFVQKGYTIYSFYNFSTITYTEIFKPEAHIMDQLYSRISELERNVRYQELQLKVKNLNQQEFGAARKRKRFG